MKVGLFSDYYLSQTDGTAIAVEISRESLEKAGHQAFVFCPERRFMPTERARIVSFKSFPVGIYPGLRFCWPFSKRTLSAVQSSRLDVIHVHTPALVGLSGLWASKKLNLPKVFTTHLDMDFVSSYGIGLIATPILAFIIAIICRDFKSYARLILKPRKRAAIGYRRDMAWRSLAFMAKQFDLVIVPSHKIHKQLSLYYKKDNLVVVPNGVDLPTEKNTKSQIRLELGINNKDFVIVNSSRHVLEKRVDELIKAMVRISREAPQAKLFLLGDGPRHGYLRQLASELGLVGNVFFLGSVPRTKVFEYLSAADVYANACLREVASLSILEAGASGLPLLIYDNRLVEPLEDGKNGFFIKDSKDLEKKIIWLSKNSTKTKKMGQASKERVSNKYDSKHHVRQLIGAYKLAISSRV